MKLDAFGKRLEVKRENETWVIYELGEGKKSRSNDVYIPDDYNQAQVLEYLNDLFHERATPDNPTIRVLD